MHMRTNDTHAPSRSDLAPPGLAAKLHSFSQIEIAARKKLRPDVMLYEQAVLRLEAEVSRLDAVAFDETLRAVRQQNAALRARCGDFVVSRPAIECLTDPDTTLLYQDGCRNACVDAALDEQGVP